MLYNLWYDVVRDFEAITYQFTPTFFRATNARKPLKPACTIPCVTNWAFLPVNGLSLFFNSVIPFSLSLKHLVFLVSAKSVLADRQALWQDLGLVLVSASCHCAWLCGFALIKIFCDNSHSSSIFFI